MATTYKVWDFPNLPVSKQVFHVPGAVFDGGFTSGGARISSPEPGGRAVLELQLALSVNEFSAPLVSWLMSKTNGEIFRVKLAKTPQILRTDALGIASGGAGIPWAAEGFYSESAWDNDMLWTDDVAFYAAESALEGATVLVVDLTGFDDIIMPGHVIGHGDSCHMVNDLDQLGNIATLSVTPPLRRPVSVGDLILTEPVFIGTISNGSEIRTTYDASNNGHIALNRIVFNEVVL